MASSTQVVTEEVLLEDLDADVRRQTREILQNHTASPIWSGIEWCLNVLRDILKEFFKQKIASLPIVGKWAGRIGTTITEFVFTILQTLISFLRVVLNSERMWITMHAAAMRAWEDNADRGLLAQTYAYGKKMASYFLEILVQCLERAIRANNLDVSAEEREEISLVLDSLLSNTSAVITPSITS